MTTDYDEMTGVQLIEHALEVDDEAVRDLALSRIEDKIHGVKRNQDSGVAPAEFKRLETVRNALETAKTVFANIWLVKNAKTQ
ncbi:MAG: hypothetical protein GY935_02145 [Gammaproteobacteria bacterium]|nr:hypothetical protein [Gammaproteobacteria bacterium]